MAVATPTRSQATAARREEHDWDKRKRRMESPMTATEIPIGVKQKSMADSM